MSGLEILATAEGGLRPSPVHRRDAELDQQAQHRGNQSESSHGTVLKKWAFGEISGG
jgi:hypothetical protein